MKKVFVAFLTLLAIFLLTVDLGQGFSCDDAKKKLLPCLGYLIGVGGDAPPSSCCNAIIDLKSSALTKDDRRAACECLKAAARGFLGIKDGLVTSLPKQCGVDVDSPSPRTSIVKVSLELKAMEKTTY